MTRLSMTVGAFADFAISTAAAQPDFTLSRRLIPNPWNRVRRDAWPLRKPLRISDLGLRIRHLTLPIRNPQFAIRASIPPLFPPARSRSRHPSPTYRLPGQKARRARPRDSDRRHLAARSRSSFPFRLRPTGRLFLWRSPAAGGQRRGLPPDILRRPSASRDRD